MEPRPCSSANTPALRVPCTGAPLHYSERTWLTTTFLGCFSATALAQHTLRKPRIVVTLLRFAPCSPGVQAIHLRCDRP